MYTTAFKNMICNTSETIWKLEQHAKRREFDVWEEMPTPAFTQSFDEQISCLNLIVFFMCV